MCIFPHSATIAITETIDKTGKANKMVTDWEDKNKRKELGQHLQNLREARKITQQQLSKSAGCSKNYVSAVERGINKLTVPLLLEYCEALHLTPNDILGYAPNRLDHIEVLDLFEGLSKDEQELAIRLLKAIKK